MKATFFVIGRHARAHPRLVAEIARRGHRVENHTETHPPLFACYTAGLLRRGIPPRQGRIPPAPRRPPAPFPPPRRPAQSAPRLGSPHRRPALRLLDPPRLR